MAHKKVAVPPAIPDEETVQQWVDQLAEITKLVGAHGVVLTPAERRRVAKIKKGGKDLLPKLTDMAARHGVQIHGLALADLQPHLDLIARLDPLVTAVQSADTLVSDTTLNAKSQTWKGLSAIYTILSRVAVDNPALRDELTSTTAFFKAPRPKTTSAKKKDAALATKAAATETTPVGVTPVVTAAAVPTSSTPTQG
jgi:hypothetical protein